MILDHLRGDSQRMAHSFEGSVIKAEKNVEMLKLLLEVLRDEFTPEDREAMRRVIVLEQSVRAATKELAKSARENFTFLEELLAKEPA